MSHEFLPQFRRRLFDWLKFRLERGRLPFRRVEELPEVVSDGGLATPDLVLWINRDSLLAGAMILIPPKTETTQLADASRVASALGLRQFVTWEARAVNIWESDGDAPRLFKSWPVPASDSISMDAFATVFEQLLLELKNLAVSAALPVELLPPAYYANLCRQVLRDSAGALQETARMAAATGQSDTRTRQTALDKGWLTLWRLLAVLRHDRLPCGIRPERLDRALGYAIAGLDPRLLRLLAPAPDELTLPESTAVRFHHLTGRLAQLGWQHDPAKVHMTLTLLFAETTRDYQVESTLLDTPAGRQDLLVNHIPLQPLAETTLVAPRPCLCGWALLVSADESLIPAHLFSDLANFAAEPRPMRVIASLHDTQPLSSAQRRQRQTALRHPWPYRRFELPANTPAWLWDALHLGGLVDPDGQIQLTIPAAWTEAPGAELLWRALIGRQTLTGVTLRADGRQTLTLVGHDRAAAHLTIRCPDGSSYQQPLLLEAADFGVLARLSLPSPAPLAAELHGRRGSPELAEEIAAKVFRDGLPSFPEHYLRRIDLPPLRRYRFSGPLQATSHFFDRIRLTAADGSFVDSDNPADAEALLLASRDGRQQLDLPIDQALTMRLIAAYRNDLHRLWQELLDECRRHIPSQRAAMALARRLWQERNLPPGGDN